MKITKLLMIICMFLVLIGSVSATRYVEYRFREDIINDQGNTYTNNPVTDVNAIGYVCADNHCEAVSGNLWGGAVQNSGSSDSMVLTYPTSLQSSDGYGVFYYKPGYVTWESNPDWWGTKSGESAANPAGPYTVYMGKIESCHAPIDTFTILNEVQPNVPVVIEIEASLDATTYAAIHHAGPLAYVPPSLATDYYSVETEVTLEITKFNTLVDRQTMTINIPFSGSQRVQFTWVPEEVGDYKAKVVTDVTDDKCMASEEQYAMSHFSVIEEDPKDMCYTLLNDLAISNQFPTTGETITITANKISNHADDIYRLTPVPTRAILTIRERAGGSVVGTANSFLAANPNTQDVEGFSFLWTIPDAHGWYDISVHAIAEDAAMCPNRRPNIDETETIGIYVGEPVNGAPTLSGLPDRNLNENQAPPGNWIDLWQYASDAETADEDLQFNIVSQSNANLLNCRINSQRYVNCNTPAYNTYGYSDVTVEVSDGVFTDRDTFRINVNRVNDYPIISNIPNVRFDIGDELSLDLDHYTHDPDNTNDELTWSWTGNDKVQVEFDPVKHIVTFSGERHWTGEERLTFTVTDPDGLSDTDICIVYIDIPKPENDDIMVARVRSTDYLLPGDMLFINVGLESNTYEDLEDLRITAVIQELGIRSATTSFTLEGRKELSRNIYMELPNWAAPGLYDIRLTISNDNLRRVIHRDVIIV